MSDKTTPLTSEVAKDDGWAGDVGLDLGVRLVKALCRVAPACEEEAGADSGSDRKRGSGRVVSAALEADDASSLIPSEHSRSTSSMNVMRSPWYDGLEKRDCPIFLQKHRSVCIQMEQKVTQH